MQTKTKVIIATVSLAIAFAAGRYLTPVKIKTEIKTVVVEKKVETTKVVQNKKRHKKTVIVQTQKPDGEKDVTTTITDDTNTGTDTKIADTTSVDKEQDAKKEVTKESSHLMVSILGGVQVNASSLLSGTSPLVYGAHVQKSLLGPINIGLFGLSNGILGCSAGLIF